MADQKACMTSRVRSLYHKWLAAHRSQYLTDFDDMAVPSDDNRHANPLRMCIG